MKMIDVANRAENLIKGVVEAEGLELVHVEYQPKGGRSVLRIFIDKPGGVDLSDCEEVSRNAGVLLDVEDLIPTKYVLEVSSPGLERPLFKEADYVRFEGKEIKLTSTEKIEGRRNFTGIINKFSEGVLQLQADDRTYSIPFEKIKKAHLVYRFE